MLHAGLDLSRRKIDVCLLSEQGEHLAHPKPRACSPAGRRSMKSRIHGRDDRVVPLANAEFLDARLPRSRVAIIDGGHFIWEEAPAEYASIVLDSIAGRVE